METAKATTGDTGMQNGIYKGESTETLHAMSIAIQVIDNKASIVMFRTMRNGKGIWTAHKKHNVAISDVHAAALESNGLSACQDYVEVI